MLLWPRYSHATGPNLERDLSLGNGQIRNAIGHVRNGGIRNIGNKSVVACSAPQPGCNESSAASAGFLGS
jgi:hypothetical protein